MTQSNYFCPQWDLNPGPPEQQVDTLTTMPSTVELVFHLNLDASEIEISHPPPSSNQVVFAVVT